MLLHLVVPQYLLYLPHMFHQLIVISVDHLFGSSSFTRSSTGYCGTAIPFIAYSHSLQIDQLALIVIELSSKSLVRFVPLRIRPIRSSSFCIVTNTRLSTTQLYLSKALHYDLARTLLSVFLYEV